MNIKYNKALWLIIILAIVMMIPFLGLSDFNTKGEPREAVVAYTMLEHGNWILPINNGGDIPYKPPFFHWCIAFFSLIAGHVNEYTSRLPSAVSLVLMTIGGFVFYAKRKDTQTSLITAIIRSLGDKALFNLDTALLKRKLGAPYSRPLADFLPTLNIKAKDFAAEMTSVNVQQKDLHGQQSICQEHVDNNKAVRNMMLQRGIVPENLPADEDVKKVESRLKSDEKTLTKKNSKKK